MTATAEDIYIKRKEVWVVFIFIPASSWRVISHLSIYIYYLFASHFAFKGILGAWNFTLLWPCQTACRQCRSHPPPHFRITLLGMQTINTALLEKRLRGGGECSPSALLGLICCWWWYRQIPRFSVTSCKLNNYLKYAFSDVFAFSKDYTIRKVFQAYEILKGMLRNMLWWQNFGR